MFCSFRVGDLGFSDFRVQSSEFRVKAFDRGTTKGGHRRSLE